MWVKLELWEKRNECMTQIIILQLDFESSIMSIP